MADQPAQKTLEMRVAELEDKLAKLNISEDEIKAYQKVSAALGGTSTAAAAQPCVIQSCHVQSCHVLPCIINQCAWWQCRPCVPCVCPANCSSCAPCAAGGGGGFGTLGG